jgi:uncharacterized protein with PQ loop repeat
MNTTEMIGFFSAFLTTIAFVPQAYHSWKTRDLSGVSLPMYSLFSAGVLDNLWLKNWQLACSVGQYCHAIIGVHGVSVKAKTSQLVKLN